MDAAFERDYLLYAVSGALRVTVGRETLILPPSFAAWVPAQTPMRVDIRKPVTTCSVLTSPGFCASFPTRATVFQMSPMARHMIRHCKRWGPEATHPPQAELFFRALLDVCADLSARSVDVKRPAATEPVMQNAIDQTEARLSEPVTAGMIARSVNLSERSMQRRFRDEVGLTWSETLSRLRMIHAVQLLAEDELSVIQIAGEVGFNSLSAFNRAFRNFAEKTPTEFRKALRG
ncbi:AraC family transcriptional regulator [Pseudaestuariivita sp.]|uniref:AraC family transcriptional regulator n=1 Tax=Pseudaestuariivita sp. TaxID=2211669 RepID=UPI0040588ACB